MELESGRVELGAVRAAYGNFLTVRAARNFPLLYAARIIFAHHRTPHVPDTLMLTIWKITGFPPPTRAFGGRPFVGMTGARSFRNYL